MKKRSILQSILYILGYVGFVMIPVCGLTAIILLGKRLTNYLYNHITKVPIFIDIMNCAFLIIIFFACLYAAIFLLNLLRKDKMNDK